MRVAGRVERNDRSDLMATKPFAKKTSSVSNKGNKESPLQKPLQPSKELAAVIGSEHRGRSEVVSKVWDYIKAHNLQNPENRREI